MTTFTADHFEDLCRTAPVDERIASLETVRKAAVKKFWLRLLLSLAASIAAILTLWDVQQLIAVILFAVLLIGGIVWAWMPLQNAKEGLKQPVLEALAAKAGMTYVPDNFDPPVFAEAQPILFGKWISSATFSDLFHGKDDEGRNFAFYEGCLTRQAGKNTQQVFSGQIYALQRQGSSQGITVIVPDRGMFNFFKPAPGMERVNFDDHPEFEKRFEVYSTAPTEAKMLLASRVVRDQLLEARGSKWTSRMFVYLGPEDAFVAIQGSNRFEPGSMFSSRSGEERVRRMFDEVCESMSILKRIREAFG